MTMSQPSELPEKLNILSAKDDDLGDIFSPGFLDRYEVHSYRNAARILASARSEEFAELVETLEDFQIKTADIAAPGGNKSPIVKEMEQILYSKGWYETRIRGDLHIGMEKKIPNAGDRNGTQRRTTLTDVHHYVIKNFVDGHKIDFIKNRLAFDMEWNSKDQTFDRDLYAARTFYECGIIDACILVTRSRHLAPIFVEIGSRLDVGRNKFKQKYGASTTWMGKLLYRLDAGRNGGCPVLAIGITPKVIADFEEWKEQHPIIQQKLEATDLIQGEGDDVDD
jgi:CRISPR-associated protein Csd2